ncbi:MAG: dCTP deaminase domain-containing protein, partial [bacterium]
MRNFHTSLEKLYQLISPIHQEQIQYQVENEIKINFITHLPTSQNYNAIEDSPKVLKKVNLRIRFQFPKHYCALLLNKSSARLKYEVNIKLGLIDIGYHNYVAAVIQNMTDREIILRKGTAVAQLLLIKAKI